MVLKYNSEAKKKREIFLSDTAMGKCGWDWKAIIKTLFGWGTIEVHARLHTNLPPAPHSEFKILAGKEAEGTLSFK